MMCIYHYIQCVDINSDSIIRMFSKEFQTDTEDFKAFFRSRQASLEACAVRLADGNCYFWSRYNKGNGWEHVGTAKRDQFTMSRTKELLASTIPGEYVHFDLALASEYLMDNWQAFSFTVNEK